MNKLKHLIKSTIRQYLNEQQKNEDNLNDNFWNWFGYSETYDDATSSPIIYYHGTDAIFDTFNSNIKLKTPFAHDDHGLGFFFSNNKSFVKQFGNNIMPVYLKIENPEIMDYDMYIKALSPGGMFNGSDYPTYDGESLRKYLIKDGKDGVIATGFNNNTDLIVCFEPNQIKSINNDGSWDIDDDNIYS